MPDRGQVGGQSVHVGRGRAVVSRGRASDAPGEWIGALRSACAAGLLC